MKATRLGVLRRALMETSRRRYIIPGVLPVGTCFFYGDSGVGKTGLTIRTAVAIAGGLQWADRKPTAGAVLYVAGEDYHGVTERLSAATEFLGLDVESLPIAVMHCPEKGLVDGSARIDVANAAKALVADTKSRMSLIVFDTLATCFGNEKQDDATAAGRFLKNAERLSQEFECAVLTVHHTGKSGDRNGMRGSSVFHANSDSRALLRRGGGATIVQVEKVRNEPGGARFAFDIIGVDLAVSGGTISVQVVKNLNAWSSTDTDTKDQDKARRDLTDAALARAILERIAVDGRASLKRWQKECFDHWKHKPSDSARRTAFSTARKKLVQSGSIIVAGDVVSVSVSGTAAYTAPDVASPEPVSVSVSTTPSKGGVHERTDSPESPVIQESISDVIPDAPLPSAAKIGKPNGFPRGAGDEIPAKGRGAVANADADSRSARTGTGG